MENIIPLYQKIVHKNDRKLSGEIIAHAIFNNGLHAEVVYLILPNKAYRIKHQLPDMTFIGLWDIDLDDSLEEKKGLKDAKNNNE